MNITNCTDVPGLLYKKASSINTHNNCVVLYSHESCYGRNVTIAPGTNGHSHLKEVNFDDTTASMGPCDEEEADKVEDKGKRTRRNINIFTNLLGADTSSSSESESNENQDNGQANFRNIVQGILQNFHIK